ncbi:MAG: chromate resistance protein [Alphaproteobacteria bacterium]|nr:chromate resistance protein [Alphaproteobacteria bacterium]
MTREAVDMSSSMSARAISPSDCHAAVGRGEMLLFDVRREAIFRAADDLAQGAQWRDPAHAARWAGRLLRGRAVAVYCVHGHEVSRQAAAELARAGHDVRYVEGGLAAWTAEGLPVVSRRQPRPGTTYVTRERPKIDRVAVPWLILRFVDPSARFLYVAQDQVLAVAAESGALPFDVPDVEIGHSGDFCSFDTCIDKFRIGAPGLDRLARIVRGADTGRHDLAAQAPGLLAVSLGLSRLHADDHAMLAAALPVYDALLAWCAEATGESHSWQPEKI